MREGERNRKNCIQLNGGLVDFSFYIQDKIEFVARERVGKFSGKTFRSYVSSNSVQLSIKYPFLCVFLYGLFIKYGHIKTVQNIKHTLLND